MSPNTLFNTQFPEALGSIMARLLATGRWEGELVPTRRDGTFVTVAGSRTWSFRLVAPNSGDYQSPAGFHPGFHPPTIYWRVLHETGD
jgi:hypothetical protein